jgi:hypothetical protein
LKAGLDEEPGAGRGVQPVAADRLQGDGALELLVEAGLDGAHAAFGERAVHAHVANAVSGDNQA